MYEQLSTFRCLTLSFPDVPIQEMAVQALTATGVSLDRLNVENTFVEELPGDSSSSNVPRQVFGSLWSPVEPTPAGGEPSMIVYSRDVCELLNLDPDECNTPEFALIMAGAAPFPHGRSYAQVRTFHSALSLLVGLQFQLHMPTLITSSQTCY
jgi:hypothetical protein